MLFLDTIGREYPMTASVTRDFSLIIAISLDDELTNDAVC